MYKRSSQGWSKHADFFLCDEISLQLAFIVAVFFRHHKLAYSMRLYMNFGFMLFLMDIIILVFFNTMHNVVKRSAVKEFTATIRHCLYVFAFATIYLFVTKSGGTYSRIILSMTFVFHVVFGYLLRTAWKWYLKRIGTSREARRSMLAVLDADTAQQMLLRLSSGVIVEGYDIIGLVLKNDPGVSSVLDIPVVASLDNAAAYICQEWVDSVYIDCPSTDPQIAKLMDACHQMAVPVHYHVPAMSENGIKQFVEKVGGTTVLTTSINYASPYQLAVKRCMDILGGIIGSLAALIIMAIVGPMIKLASPGPILYRQERIGMNGKRFQILKMRSMHVNADSLKKDLMEQNRVKDGMMFKMDFDPRIIGNEVLPDGTRKTGIGEFIRRTSLDEFPQFFNVLRGQMSLVGTRPPTVDEWEKYEYHHRARLACKPGITGMWQVSGRSEITDFEEVVRLDTKYITNWSLGLDVQILFKTISVVFARKGAI